MRRPTALTDSEVARLARDAVSVQASVANSGIVLLCEHGGRHIPDPWEKLGLPDAFLDTHYAYDIGSRSLTAEVARRIDGVAVIANYSRIFLDYNRKSHDPCCIRLDMGGVPVPGNLKITDEERELRERIARHPVEVAVSELLEGERGNGRAIVSIHSFSPVWENCYRACEIGIMWKQDGRFSLPLIEAIRNFGGFSVEENQPYSFADSDWFTLDRHGLSIGVPHAYIEVRNDLIGDQSSIDKMADFLAASIVMAFQSLDEGRTARQRAGECRPQPL